MAVYTIRNNITEEATTYGREEAREELKRLLTVKDMTNNNHWYKQPLWTNSYYDNAYTILNKCVDRFIDWIFETIPLNGVGMGFDQFTISASQEYMWDGTSFTKDELLALITTKEDDWFRMAMDWFNDEYHDYKVPFDLTWDNIFKEDFKHSTYDNEFSDRLFNNYYDYLEDNLTYEVENGNIKLTNDDTGEITAVKMWQFV